MFETIQGVFSHYNGIKLETEAKRYLENLKIFGN